jgi:hypothetical protein
MNLLCALDNALFDSSPYEVERLRAEPARVPASAWGLVQLVHHVELGEAQARRGVIRLNDFGDSCNTEKRARLLGDFRQVVEVFKQRATPGQYVELLSSMEAELKLHLLLQKYGGHVARDGKTLSELYDTGDRSDADMAKVALDGTRIYGGQPAYAGDHRLTVSEITRGGGVEQLIADLVTVIKDDTKDLEMAFSAQPFGCSYQDNSRGQEWLQRFGEALSTRPDRAMGLEAPRCTLPRRR